MKKLLQALFLLALPSMVWAQTGINGSEPPKKDSQNPYSNPYTNPYESNPYTGSEQIDNWRKSQTEDKTDDKKKSASELLEQGNRKLDMESLKDMNQARKQAEEELKSSYLNDPDYLQYLRVMNQQKKDTLKVNEPDSTSQDQKKVYGAAFFTNNVYDLSDKSPGVPPADYRLGPGDEITVSLWGNAELQQSYTLAKDGSIFPKLVGKIFLQGLTFDAASQVIENKFKKIVPSTTSIDVQLKNARTIRITVVGEVKKQGTYTMSAFNTALNALFRAGGVTPNGNMRRIEVIRDGRVVDELDIYSYLKSGNRVSEIYLEDNDRILVSVYDKLIEAKGLFKRPMYYQLREDEGVRELIDFAGGSLSDARNSLIHIKTVKNEKRVYLDINWNAFSKGDYDNVLLNDGDVVELRTINEGLKNVVLVEGAVDYPDEYEVIQGMRVRDLIQKAGGVSGKAYKPRAYLFRAGSPLESDAIKIDLNSLNDLETNVEVFAGDRLKILSTKDFEQEYFIEVNGYVRSPKRVPYYKNMKLKDALLLCGGLRLDAENGRIEISNIVDSVNRYTLESKGNQIKMISIDANLELDDASENITIKPMDRIYVRRKSEFLNLEKIQIVGEVVYAGEYVLVGKNERLSSVIKRAGGLKKSAYAEGARLYRMKIGQIVVDLNSALNNKGSNQDIVLKDSDIVIIPSINDIVSIRGEVQSEVNIKFDPSNLDVRYYINSAGGYGERPWKRRIYVKDQNGKIRTTKTFLIFKRYPSVKEGTTVYVPVKPKKENQTKFSEVFSYSLSALTTLATLLILSKSL